MMLRERLQAWRYNLVPDHLLGEILSKRWADNAIPFLAMVATVAGFGSAIPGFFNPSSLVESTRQLGEFTIVVVGLTVVMLAGGIDLSVGSIFALAAFASVSTFFIFGLPVWVALLAALATGAVLGALNGYLIGYLHLRAFLTTLVTLVIGRALYDILVVNFAALVQQSDVTSELWDFIGDGRVLGVSVSVITAIVIAIVAHIALTRSRPGWHILAVGGSRRSAHNAGMPRATRTSSNIRKNSPACDSCSQPSPNKKSISASPANALTMASTTGSTSFCLTERTSITPPMFADRGLFALERPNRQRQINGFAEQIMDLGLSEADEACSRSLDAFCSLLGSFAGNVALIVGARGGLFIGGGIVPRLGEFFERSEFRRRFEAKGRLASYLADIPTAVITDTLAALTGAAAALDEPAAGLGSSAASATNSL